jgi:predicted dehydrogenase
MSLRTNRRRFLQTGAAGLGYLYAGPAYSVAQTAGSNDRLKVAGIGVGGKGDGDINQAGSLMEVVAVCDVDDGSVANKIKRYPRAKGFTDYRKLFNDTSLLKNIDAVTVSTPDHHHALASVLAMRAGKHVYCQKPLAHTVAEARLMREAAAKYKVCTQMGNHGTAANGLRRAVELIQDGVIGPVKEVFIWTNRPIWPQAPFVTKRPDERPVPAGLHWDEFIGPVAFRPYATYAGLDLPANLLRYNRGAYHAFNWRGWWDFGTGAIGDMACHTANMAFMALDLGLPVRVSAEATDVNPETCPSSAHVTMEFPARGERRPVTVHWYEGQIAGKKRVPPAEWVEKATTVTGTKKELVNSGSILVGEKGFIYSPDDYGAQFFVGPQALAEGVKNTTRPERLPINNKGDQGQKTEWVEAIKAGKPEAALSHFDRASRLTESFLLGNVAIRSGRSFEYDGETGKIKGDAEAEKYLRVEYRKGWDLLGDKA